MRYSVRLVLWIGFGLIVGLFLVASVVTVRSVEHILTIEKQLTLVDHAKHHGHLTLADIQQQYIHQAHTIILGDKSHLGHYNEAQRATETRIAQLSVACQSIDSTDGIVEIMATAQKMDRYFRDTVLEGIVTSDAKTKHVYHSRLEAFSNLARTQILDLNTVLDQKNLEARRNHEKSLANTRRATLGAFFSGLIMAVAIALTITRMIGRPISKLHEAFGLIGAGHMQARVSPKGPRELNELGKSFNTMADELVAAHKKVATKERMATMGEIAAGVAHELNNPLGVITGYLKLLRKGDSGEQAQRDLSVIDDEVTNCKGIVQGLLDLARPAKLKKSRMNVVALVDDVVQRLNTSGSRAGATFDVQSSARELNASVDEVAIKQVLNNLVRNAVEAAGDDGEVAIEIADGDDTVTIAVSDSGPGIDTDFEADLFKPFKTTKEKGTGLGLAISLAIARNHGGDISADRGPLGGARFTVILPVNAALEDQEAEKQ